MVGQPEADGSGEAVGQLESSPSDGIGATSVAPIDSDEEAQGAIENDSGPSSSSDLKEKTDEVQNDESLSPRIEPPTEMKHVEENGLPNASNVAASTFRESSKVETLKENETGGVNGSLNETHTAVSSVDVSLEAEPPIGRNVNKSEEVEMSDPVASPSEISPESVRRTDNGGSSDKPHPVSSTSRNSDCGRPPLPKRPPANSYRRHRSHSMDNSELSSLGIMGGNKNGSDAEFVDPFLVLPSAASTGLLDESEHFDNLDTGDEPQFSSMSPDVIDAFSNPNLDDDTPVAAALRANAEVHVSNVSKFARRIKAQNIRRFVKKAALIGKSDRGKPPRAPPFRGAENDVIGGSMPNIYALQEENGDLEFMDSSIDSDDKLTSGGGSVGSRGAQKSKELPNSAPPTTLHQRSASQPALPTDAWGHRSQSINVDIDDIHPEFGAHGIAEKEKTATAKFGSYSHAGPGDGIPAEVHTSPEAGRGKLQLGPHLKTWKRRKGKKRKEGRKSYVKGKVIDGQHELYTLSIAVMLGLRTSIGMTNKQMSDSSCRKWLESVDFSHSEKYVFRPKGGPRTPPHQLSHTFKFKDYCPLVFAYMRRMFGINEFEFLLSVCGNANFIEFISNAKSGQFFFYSYDGKYMIKTMTNAESKFLRRILPEYFRHCSKNPNTLITKFLGMYRVKLYHLRRNVKFVIMNSVFDTDKVIKSLFDLKGSTTGRDAKPHHDVKKDNDFRRGRPDTVMALKPDVRTRVREQIVRDCEFFKKMQIMDYSMLVGVHYIPPKHKLVGESSHRLGDSSGRLSFRDSLRDVGNRKKSSQRYSQTDDQKSNVNISGGNSKSTDMPFPTPGKDQEKKFRTSGGSTALPKPHTPGRKTSVGTMHSAASISSDAGVIGDATVASLQTLEYIFDDDDDNSFLDGSNLNPFKPVQDTAVMASITAPGNYHVSKDTIYPVLPGPIPLSLPIPGGQEEGSISTRPDDVEVKKELTTQQMFWPFHRFYDIHGLRRMVPARCSQCEELDCSCGGNKEAFKKWNVAAFEPPLSNRKDRGFMMDMHDVKTPLRVKLPNGGVLNCEGKIFYFGIIDILQQFNSRKRAEAVLRRYQGSGWQDASCVHPDLYADRFVSFFDECTQRDPVSSGVEDDRFLPSDKSDLGSVDVEEIKFHEAATSDEGNDEIPPPDPDVETPKTKTKGNVSVDA